jgi:hypothetical protein
VKNINNPSVNIENKNLKSDNTNSALVNTNNIQGNNTNEKEYQISANSLVDFCKKKDAELKQYFLLYNQYLSNLYEDFDKIIKNLKENIV